MKDAEIGGVGVGGGIVQHMFFIDIPNRRNWQTPTGGQARGNPRYWPESHGGNPYDHHPRHRRRRAEGRPA